MKKMRLLILGTGNMAKLQSRHWHKMDDVELVGAVDVDPNNLEAYCTEFGVKRRFASLEAALDWGEFDAISNVTPDSMHHPTALAALAAGKHVFCEKPLATDYEKAMEMTEVAEGKDLWVVGGGELVGQLHDAGLLDEVWVQYAPVTIGSGAPVLPRHVELRLEEVARNRDFMCGRYSVVR